MKTSHNLLVVPHYLVKNAKGAMQLFFAMLKIYSNRLFTKRNYKYNHFKNLALVYFKPTGACNLRCKMCGQYGDKGVMNECAQEENKKILPLETWKSFVDQIAPKKPVIYVWGGEPMLYPDIIPLCKYMVDKGLFVSVNTNGTLIEKYAKEIVRDKWSNLFVSLDAFRDVNDEQRGKGSYDKVVAGFKAINEEKKKQKSKYPCLSVVTVVTNKNYQDVANLAEASKEFDIDLHVFNLGTYTNDKIVDLQKKLMKEKFDTDIDCLEAYNTGYNTGIDGKKLHDILQHIHKTDFGHPMLTVPVLNPEKTHIYYADLETPVRNHCVVPWCQLNVNYNGDVHFCADYPDYILGNIKNQSVKEIYNGDRANKFRKELHNAEGGMFPGCLRCYQNMLFGKKIKGF